MHNNECVPAEYNLELLTETVNQHPTQDTYQTLFKNQPLSLYVVVSKGQAKKLPSKLTKVYLA